MLIPIHYMCSSVYSPATNQKKSKCSSPKAPPKMIDHVANSGNTSCFADTITGTIYRVEQEMVDDFDNITVEDQILSNDRYHKYKVKIATQGIMNVIYDPKDSEKEKHFVKGKYITFETPADYQRNSDTIERSDKKWIYNIINKTAEVERVIFDNDHFIMLPNSKWSVGQPITDLYLLIITKDKKLRSIRDLTAEHIPLLEEMITIANSYISDKLGGDTNQFRMYFHYKPSTWHLHLHINNINSTKPISCQIEHAHSIYNVIANLHICSDYYKRVTLEVMRVAKE